ncbi:MAG: sulfite exporter TauE/SafE family protein [Propionibacteriaceae bacterium]|nr:sulfite exporter TauE/SafE family protein [Propionibacteriaceae bacterium]
MSEIRGRRDVALLLAVGLLAGFLSGFFGIGGGTVIVPALVWIGFSQRHAVATSLAAIVPTAVAGVVSYVVAGHVAWALGGLLIVGVLAGARLGSALLSRLPETVLRWAFVAFLALLAVSQFTLTPSRDAAAVLDWPHGVAMVGLGLVTGVLSGLLGIGGGVVIVPGLTFLFGLSDLVARGTSLLVMIPGAATGTWSNWRKKLVDLRAAAWIGLPAIAATPLGAWTAHLPSPKVNAVLFGVYLTVLVARSLYAAAKK